MIRLTVFLEPNLSNESDEDHYCNLVIKWLCKNVGLVPHKDTLQSSVRYPDIHYEDAHNAIKCVVRRQNVHCEEPIGV